MRYYVLFVIFFFSCALPAFPLQISSPAFKNGENIPSRYTCDGPEDMSPPLSWSDAPKSTKSFALICEDPDAPLQSWVHWIIFNIPGDQTRLSEGIEKLTALADGIKQGNNDFKRPGYGGPCPPPGKPHTYVFKLYALDTTLKILTNVVVRKDLVEAMRGHILAEASYTGLYKRK